MKASAFKAQLWVLILTSFPFFCSRTHLKLVCTSVVRCFLSQRRNQWVKVRYNRPFTWNHCFQKINEWIKEATLACQFFAMWVGSLFSRKNQHGTVGYMYPWQTVINIFSKSWNRSFFWFWNLSEKPNPRFVPFWKKFQKKLEPEILWFLELKKPMWRLLTKSRNHTTQGLLFWF